LRLQPFEITVRGDDAAAFVKRFAPERGTGSNRAEIYSSVLYARSTRDLDAGNNNMPGF
jgi:hypothetical protein